MVQVKGKAHLFALMAAVCLVVSCFATGGATAVAAEEALTAGAIDAAPTIQVQADDSQTSWATVDFNVLANLKKLNIKWDWNDLLQDATTAGENKNLLVAGIVLSEEAELSSARVESALGQIGFGDLQSDYYQLSTGTQNGLNEPGRTFGHKVVTKGGKDYHIVCAVFKGATTSNDILTGIAAAKDGFLAVGESCHTSLASYVSTIEGARKDNTILFITGHNLGAAAAHVVGRLSGDLARDKATFVYTIASPDYALGDDAGTRYPNFRTFTNEADPVPSLSSSLLGQDFGKDAIEHVYRYEDLSTKENGRFNTVYRYLTDKYYEDDIKDHGDLKNHLCQTYLAFALCDLASDELERYLGMSRENGLTVATKAVVVDPKKKTVLKKKRVFEVQGAQGKVTFAKVDGESGIKIKSGGKVVVKKKVAPGVYVVKVAVTAAGDEFYQEKTVNKSIEIRVKKVNPMTVTGKTATVSAGERTILERRQVLTVINCQGALSCTKKSGDGKIAVTKGGKVKVGKGLKKGTYKVKVAVTAAGTKLYAPKTVTKTITIRAVA